MEFIADALLIAGATGAGAYCMVLSKRLRALKDLDSGLGAAIATLSRQVDEMRGSLESAKALTGDQNRSLSQLTARAEMAAGRLELLLAALHENGRKRPLNVARGDDEDDEAREPSAAPATRPAAAAAEAAVKPFAALRRAAAGDS
jgi:hypothetical protein